MNQTINFYNTSDIYWYPVQLNLLSNEYNVKTYPLIFKNGIKFELQECLNDCKDVSLNKKTGLFLTDLTKINNFLEENEDFDQKEPLKTILTPLANIDNKILINTTLSSSNFGVEPWNRLCISERLNFTVDDNFILNFYKDDDDEYVTIQSSTDEKYLTWLGGSGQGNLIIYPKIYPSIPNQKFRYLLGKDNIILFQYKEYYSDIILNDPLILVNQVLDSTAFGLSSMPPFFQANMPPSSIIKLISYKKLEPNNKNLKNSFLAKYKVDPLTRKNQIELDPEYTSIPYSQNYLGMFPFEYPIISNDKAIYPLHMHGLKNYQTPEYNYGYYAKNSEILENEFGVRRDYHKIFTGTNQTEGLSQVYLSYHSDTLKMEFPPDKDVPFYYSPTSTRKKIQESSLIEDGALAGEIPFISDRLFFKLEDYSQTNIGQPQPPSIKNLSKDVTNGSWLCSWLHLSANGEYVWLDRYYNSAYYTVNEALTSKVYAYKEKIDSTSPFVIDVPSTMYLEPGGLYRFYHTGKQSRKDYLNYVDQIDNDPHLPLGSKFLHVENWNSDPLTDSSKYKNNGILYYNKLENLKGDYFELDGTNHALFPAKSILLEQTKLTASLWINVDDWNNVEGSQIFGNYYDSGFGLINESALTTPIITLVNGNNNKYYNINYRFGKINEVFIQRPQNINPIDETLYVPPTREGNKNRFILRLPDYSFWVFDVQKYTATKFSIDDQKLTEIFYGQYVNDVSQVEIDGEENIYLYDNTQKRYVKYNTYGVYLDDKNVPQNTNRIEIDLNNNVIPIYGTFSIIDSKNTVWQILGGNLYKGTNPLDLSTSQIFANIGNVQSITCDAENYLWIAHEQDTITKINTIEEKIEFSIRIGKYSSAPVDPCLQANGIVRHIHFIRVPTDANTNICSKNKKVEDRLLLVDTFERTLYQLDTNGNLLTKLDLTALFEENDPEIFCEGDITGYQNIRKFKTINKKFAWKIKISDINRFEPQLYSLEYQLSSLNEGWHHFTFTFDGTEGYVKSYLDSNLIQEYYFEPKKYQIAYDFRTSLLLGIQTIKNTNLNDIIEINDGYKFRGRIADLRLYGKSLTKGIIEQIFFSSQYGSNDKTMIWNMNVGKRSYVEDIKSWFKMQMPGSKSKYYNINIHNLNVSDEVRGVIENAIKKSLVKIAPANASLYKINWT